MELTSTQQAIIDDSTLSKSDRFRRLYDTGLTPHQIAQAMNTYDSFVRAALARTHSLPIRKGPTKADIFRQEHDAGVATADVARKHGAHYSHVYQVIMAYTVQKERARSAMKRPETYLFLDGQVANLADMPDHHRTYFDRCVAAFGKAISVGEFEELLFGRENPALRAPAQSNRRYGTMSRDVHGTLLVQILRDMLFRLQLRAYAEGDNAQHLAGEDPFADTWISPSDVVAILGISLTAVHKAIESGRLIAKVAKEGGSHRVISMNSVIAIQ